MAESINSNEVLKVAKLAKIQLPEKDLDVLSRKFASILELVAELNQVDCDGVEEMAHPVDIHSVTRQDQPAEGLTPSQALQNAPKSDGEYFLVPPVLG